jgi:hypothetical protein
MRDRWLIPIIAKAVIAATVSSQILIFATGPLRFRSTYGFEAMLILLIAFLPSSCAALWIFRKLQSRCTRREARAVALAFGVLTPILLAISMIFGTLAGAFAEGVVGGPFILLAAFGAPILLTIVLVFCISLFTLRMTHHIELFQ